MGSFSEKKPNLIFQLNFNFKVFWKRSFFLFKSYFNWRLKTLVILKGWKHNFKLSHIFIFFSGKLNLHICSEFAMSSFSSTYTLYGPCLEVYRELWKKNKSKSILGEIIVPSICRVFICSSGPFITGSLLILYVTDCQNET